MTMRTFRNLRCSFRALFAHRLRVALVLSCVAIGVGAVVLTSALGKGAEAEVRRGIEALGANLIFVRPAEVKRLVTRRTVRGLVTSLKVEDAAAIAELDLVEAAVPGSEGTLRVKVGNSTVVTSVLGTTPDFQSVRRFQIRKGRFFDNEDDQKARRVAVLGARVVERLFPEEDPVGRTIRIRGVPFKVVGVLEARGVQPDGSDEDNLVVVPVRTALRRVFNVSWISVIFVGVRAPERMDEAQTGIAALLRERHGLETGKPEDFTIQNKTRFLQAQRETIASLTLLTSGLASLALVVGGTGILALMLLSVRERTGEIGLRRAVGARPRDILVQFLAEAAVLAFGGWIAGAVCGALGAAMVALGTDWNVAVPFEALLASLAMAGIIGLGFGALPARQASLLPPIQALSAE